jgi:hypothetical protein
MLSVNIRFDDIRIEDCAFDRATCNALVTPNQFIELNKIHTCCRLGRNPGGSSCESFFDDSFTWTKRHATTKDGERD